ncbi:MAG: response regulator [Hyphomonadaceae bacterium]|nr:response regulator [Clostridia bacterium]
MKRILVIDDAVFMRIALKKMLENNGFQVVGEADNGLDGVRLYRELHPDLVTLDITMPEMGGIETLKEIKIINPDASVVIVSSLGQEHLLREAVLIGAKGFVLKPFKEEFIVNVINKII